MKLLVTCLLIGFSQIAFADGVSLGDGAVGAANLVRESTVSKCIEKLGQDHAASAYIRDVRVVDRLAGKYEITVFLHNGDIAIGNFDLKISSKRIGQGWSMHTVYECAPTTP